MRRNLKEVKLKNGFIFNGEKIYLQSMLNKPSKNIKENLKQAEVLEQLGCHIIRVFCFINLELSWSFILILK